jgi:8-oxo-dGTP pyrophosphatase MutT (NUDIX family)
LTLITPADMRGAALHAVLRAYVPRAAEEAADVERMLHLATRVDPWTRASALHATGSAVVVHPISKRVLLRWHERMQGWLQVGGHADPGETDPYRVALREAEEETGLHDLIAFPPHQPVMPIHIAVVPVPAGKGEPAHEHADVRYALATSHPDEVVAESETAPLAWLSVEDALVSVGEDNLRICLQRIDALFNGGGR